MFRETAVSKTLKGIYHLMELERGIHNVKMIRRWRSRDGFHKKAYEIFKEDHKKNMNRYELMTISWNELLIFLESYRSGITIKNKAPKPKWIQQ